jgi:hypothetical protein
MGYHVNPRGMSADVWEPYAKRKMIYDYCPEIKIILDMKLEREQCVEPPKIETLLDLPPPAPGNAEIETPPARGMTKEEYSAQFSKGAAGDGDLKNQIKELEEAMAELKKGKLAGEDASQSSKVDQELGDPEIADFAQVEGITTKSAEDDEG